MKKRALIIIICIAAALAVAAFAAGENADGSLVSLSYLKEIFTDVFTKQAEDSLTKLSDAALSQADSSVNSFAENAEKRIGDAYKEAISAKVAEIVLSDPSAYTGSGGKTTELSSGDRVIGYTGGGVTLISGSASVCGNGNARLLDTSDGTEHKPGESVSQGRLYMVLDNDNSGVEITSDKAEVLIKDGSYVVKAYTAVYTELADKLFAMQLFKGTNNGYELRRAPTRQEALIMLIRLLGEEKEALAFDENNMTFKDVTGWTDGRKYIAYGANKMYTNGRSADVFDQGSTADVYMYITFVLRALGYSDKDGDFVWNSTSTDLAVKLKLLTQEECASVMKTGLRRDHVVLISYNALKTNLKGTGTRLADKLIERGAITREQANAIN
ncbi:MAG: hypothetical protein IJS65_04620 [Clostridia bacterium]|nr:hypothetical protein [Clostridia bacterium]